MSSLLEKTQAFLLAKPQVATLKIRNVYLTNYFTVIELDDTSVGASMSSYKFDQKTLVATQNSIRALLREDPLLLHFVKNNAVSDAVAQSILAAVVSALSASSLRANNDPYFIVRREFPRDYFAHVKYAVVIGYGGLLDRLVEQTTVPRIHVSDLSYARRKNRLDRRTARYLRMRPGLELSVSDGSDSAEHLARADLACITGSTLANGTLEGLIRSCQDCQKIILQGQTASIHPKELFAAGVDLVITTIKTRDVAQAAFWDATGRSLRPLLEGGLPWIFLWPADSNLNQAEYATGSR